MATTHHELWYPVLPDSPGTSGIGYGEVLTGVGAPSNSVGNNGDIYVNILTGEIYSKTGDVWVISATGGDISSAEVWAASGDPVHTPTINRQIYINTDDGAQWYYYSSAWH
jgi:hypothetical protein